MDEKIVITVEECDNATPIPSSMPWQSFEDAESPEHRSPLKGIVLFVILVSFVLIVFGMVAYCIVGPEMTRCFSSECPQVKTVDQYRDECIEKMNSQLANSDDAIRKYIEGVHVTVKVTSAYVLDCNVTTVDGSNLAGKDDSNVQEVALTIRFFWDGEIHKGGHTDLALRIDARAGKVLDAKVVNTSALVNITDPKFWLGLGTLLLQ